MRHDFSFLFMKKGEGNLTIVKVYFQMLMQINFFFLHCQTTCTMNYYTYETLILFRPCPILALKEPQQPCRASKSRSLLQVDYHCCQQVTVEQSALFLGQKIVIVSAKAIFNRHIHFPFSSLSD